MNRINLIPIDRHHRRRYRQHVQWWIIACAISAAVLAMGVPVLLLSRGDVADHLTVQMAQLDQSVSHRKAAISTHQSEIDTARGRLAVADAIGDRPDWSILLALIAQERGSDAVLKRCALGEVKGGSGFRFEIEGVARSHGAASDIVRRLEETDVFSSVKLVQARRAPFLTDDAIIFEIHCGLGTGESS